MPRTADMTVARRIGDVDIYTDLAGLSDEEAIKRSKMRLRNKIANDKKKAKASSGGDSVSEGKAIVARGRKVGKSASTAGGVVKDVPESAALRDRHKAELKSHDDARAALLAKHEEELQLVLKLTRMIHDADAIPGDRDLSKPFRDMLTAMK